MAIVLQLLEAYLKCPTKCWLMSICEPIADSWYAQWVQAQNEAYLASGFQRLLSETNHQECTISPSADSLKAGKWRLAANVFTREQRLESHVHAVERLPSEGRGKPACYSPVRFVPNNRLGKDAKLLLAFDALALAEALGEKVNLGKIIHGDDHTTAQPCQMTVQKPLDIASPHLWFATVTGKVFTTIDIQVVAPTATTPYVLYDILLANAEITSIADSGSNALPLETLTLKATKVTLTFNTRNAATGAITATTSSFTC